MKKERVRAMRRRRPPLEKKLLLTQTAARTTKRRRRARCDSLLLQVHWESFDYILSLLLRLRGGNSSPDGQQQHCKHIPRLTSLVSVDFLAMKQLSDNT